MAQRKVPPRRSPGLPRSAAALDTSELSSRQRRILEVIRDSVILLGYGPSIREIGDAAGLRSTSSVAYQLKKLEDKGYVKRDPRRPRAFDIRALVDLNLSEPSSAVHSPSHAAKTPNSTPEDQEPRELAMESSTAPTIQKEPQYPAAADEANARTTIIPLVGSIAAGAPITAEENITDYYPLPTDIVGNGELFLLQVSGESMIDAGIFDGDWIVVRSQPVAEQGEFVAALIDGEATVKEFHRDRSGVWLLPHNPAYDPIPGNAAEIMGKVVSLMRKM